MSKTQATEETFSFTAIRGKLAQDALLTVLSSGEVVVNLDVKTSTHDGTATTVPVSWFGPPEWAGALVAGDDVIVTGSMRKHWWSRNANRTDLLVESVTRVTGPASVRRQLTKTMAAIQLASP